MDNAFDTKVAVVLLEDLPVLQKVNAAAFLRQRDRRQRPQLVGDAYVDRFREPLSPDAETADPDLRSRQRRHPASVRASDGAGGRGALDFHA